MTQNSTPESPSRAAADDQHPADAAAPESAAPQAAPATAPGSPIPEVPRPEAPAAPSPAPTAPDAWAAFKSAAPERDAASDGPVRSAANEDAPEAAAAQATPGQNAPDAPHAPDAASAASGKSTPAAPEGALTAPTAPTAAQDDAPLTLTPPAAPSAERASAAAAAAAPLPADKLFNALSRLGPLVPLLLLLALAWPALLGNGLYCPREAHTVLAFQDGLQQGGWLAAGAGSGLWPGYFWYLGGLHALLASAAPQGLAFFFPLAAALGALLPLKAVWVLARTAGLDRREALAGCLLLTAAPIFVPAAYFVGPESLAAALTSFSLACLCVGWQKPRAWLLLPLGFALAALAGLTGGLFHVLLPLLTSLVFLCWRSGGFARARALDGVIGFALLLALLGLWLGALMLGAQPEGYLTGLRGQLWIHPDPAHWWLPWLLAGLGLLPWLGALLCVSWTRVLRTAARNAAASRRERAGVAFLWIACLLAALLALATPHPATAALCLACLAAPLLGKAVLRLSPVGGKLFRWLAALILLLAGLALAAAGFSFSLNWIAGLLRVSLAPEAVAALAGLTGLPILGGVCLLAAVLLARPRATGAGMGATLLLGACLSVALTLTAALLLGPRLDVLPQAGLKRLEALTAPAPSAPAEAAPLEAAPAEPTPEKTTPPAPAAPEAVAPPSSAPVPAPAQEAPAAPAPTPTTPAAPEAAAPPAVKTPVPTESAPEKTAPSAPEAPAPAASQPATAL